MTHVYPRPLKQCTASDKVLSRARKMSPRGGEAIKQHELDIIDHHTGEMLQRVGGPNPHRLNTVTDVNLSDEQIARILRDPA